MFMAGAAVAQAGAPTSAQSTPSGPTGEAAPAQGEVLVVAERGPQQSIDRKSYAIRQGPAAEVSNGLDVMQNLPSVSVDAAGRIELLGNANVKILIDGRPVPDALTILRGLSAAQIARVEVITNPSAQFPSDGTGGIINIITRRSARDGLGGTLAAGVDSRGAITGRAGPTWTKDKWTLSNNIGRFAFYQPQSSEVRRQQLAGTPDGVSNRNEDSSSDFAGRGYFMRSQAIYRPAERRSLSAAFFANTFTGDQDLVNRVTPGVGGLGFVPLEQRADMRQRFTAGNLSVDYRADGTQPNQNLVIAASASTFTVNGNSRYRETSDAGAVADLLTGTQIRDRSATLKADYNTPLGERRLAVGGQLDWRQRDFFDFAQGGALTGAPRNRASSFGGSYTEAAAYVTYQTALGGWKLLPGLRVQARDYSLDAGGGPSQVQPFPSLHVERKLSQRFTGVLSYSRRVAWPDIADLTPLVRQMSPTFAMTGNPALDPETTDAIEGRISYGGKVHSFDLTLYNRITRDTFDRRITQSGDGLLLSRPINAGKRLDQGLEAAFRGRVAPGLRYTLTGNLTAVSRQVEALAERRRDAQYRGKLQLDYTSGKAGDPGYDQVTLNLRYEGPVQNFQTRRSSYMDGDLAWTHRFTPRLSSVLNVTALLGSYKIRTDLRTPFLLERRIDRNTGTTVRFTLTYQLGRNLQPLPPQPQAAPAAPPVPGM